MHGIFTSVSIGDGWSRTDYCAVKFPRQWCHDRGNDYTHQKWKTLLTSQAMGYGNFSLFANRVGSEDDFSFYGGSFIVDPFGEIDNRSSRISGRI